MRIVLILLFLVVIGGCAVTQGNISESKGAISQAVPAPNASDLSGLTQHHWVRRARYGMIQPQITTGESFQPNGDGDISIDLIQWSGEEMVKRSKHLMSGSFKWSLDGRSLNINYDESMNKMKALNLKKASYEIRFIDSNLLILSNSNGNGLNVKYTSEIDYSEISRISLPVKVDNIFSLYGNNAFLYKPDGSVQITGSPAFVEWLDEKTGFFNYLLAMHIEYYKTSNVFIATGGPTLIEASLQTMAPMKRSQMVLFTNGKSITPDSKVYWLTREPGERLTFTKKN